MNKHHLNSVCIVPDICNFPICLYSIYLSPIFGWNCPIFCYIEPSLEISIATIKQF
jgi:hypothetical protein